MVNGGTGGSINYYNMDKAAHFHAWLRFFWNFTKILLKQALYGIPFNIKKLLYILHTRVHLIFIFIEVANHLNFGRPYTILSNSLLYFYMVHFQRLP